MGMGMGMGMGMIAVPAAPTFRMPGIIMAVICATIDISRWGMICGAIVLAIVIIIVTFIVVVGVVRSLARATLPKGNDKGVHLPNLRTLGAVALVRRDDDGRPLGGRP